jgi:hypothetical protein
VWRDRRRHSNPVSPGERDVELLRAAMADFSLAAVTVPRCEFMARWSDLVPIHVPCNGMPQSEARLGES